MEALDVLIVALAVLATITVPLVAIPILAAFVLLDVPAGFSGFVSDLGGIQIVLASALLVLIGLSTTLLSMRHSKPKSTPQLTGE